MFCVIAFVRITEVACNEVFLLLRMGRFLRGEPFNPPNQVLRNLTPPRFTGTVPGKRIISKRPVVLKAPPPSEWPVPKFKESFGATPKAAHMAIFAVVCHRVG